jgi:hypothetical protein
VRLVYAVRGLVEGTTVTGRQEPYYVDYDADFGLSGVTEAFTLSPAPENTGAALGLVMAKLDAYDRECPVGSVESQRR